MFYVSLYSSFHIMLSHLLWRTKTQKQTLGQGRSNEIRGDDFKILYNEYKILLFGELIYCMCQFCVTMAFRYGTIWKVYHRYTAALHLRGRLYRGRAKNVSPNHS
jgi:hypothetical protein